MKENITIDLLLNNLPIYKELVKHINSLNTTDKIKYAAAYLRVSTDMQVEFSPEAQLKDIIVYCIQHNIMLLKEYIFIEPGISGTRADKRPEFQKMITIAEEKPKPFDLILVHKLDRFARNREDSIVYKSKLRKKLGIDVIAVKELLPEDKKLAMMMESQLETMGEYYSMNLSDEVKKGLKIKAEHGEHGTRPPLGYKKVVVDVVKIDNKEKIIRKMEIVESEAKIVKTIFQKFTIDDESVNKITQYLVSLNIKTKNNGTFNDRAVKWILNNPVYIGKLRYTDGGMNRKWDNPNTIIKDCNIPTIIDMDLWEKTQKKLEKYKIIYGSRKAKVKNEHWLRGILKCSNCGESLVKNNKTFQCTGYTHGRCNISHSILVKNVENKIIEQLKNDYVNQPINIEISKSSFDNSNDLAILKNQLEIIEQKEKRIKLAYENGIDTLEEYKENKQRILHDKEIILQQLESLKETDNNCEIREKIFKKCKDAKDIFMDPEVSTDDKALIAHNLFEKIVYKKSEKQLVIYYK